jgi:NAD(P)-dependent dehydrogenase (short-subunit alcohol dehydrogenase family)
MAFEEKFRFDGKRALVVGGATGIGGAAVDILRELGADVVVMDYAKVERDGSAAIHLDLRDKASIDAAISQCSGMFDALLSCAGVAPGAQGLHNVNFFGQRHLIERVSTEGLLRPGAAITMIASMAGRGWEAENPKMDEYLATADFDRAQKWLAAHAKDEDLVGFIKDYNWSKRAVCAYVAREAFSYLKRGMRINAVMPGTIDTQLARQNDWFSYDEAWRREAGLERPTADKAAYPLVFLSSQAAELVNGAMLLVDAGYTKWMQYNRNNLVEN